MFIKTPIITKMVMKGTLWSLLRSKNSITNETIVMPNVMTLKF